jgi:ribose 1,5-bisphosphokinase PhnN
MDEGFFAETIVYKTPFGYCYYGSAKEDYNSQDNTVVVLDPRGVINLTEPAFIVHLDLRESVLRERLFERGDSPAYIEKRLADDKLYFEEMLKRHTPDLTIKASSRIDYMGDLVLDSMDL